MQRNSHLNNKHEAIEIPKKAKSTTQLTTSSDNGHITLQRSRSSSVVITHKPIKKSETVIKATKEEVDVPTEKTSNNTAFFRNKKIDLPRRRSSSFHKSNDPTPNGEHKEKSNSPFQPRRFLAEFHGESASNYADLELAILNSEYLKTICAVYKFHRKYPAEYKTLGAVQLDMQADKVDYVDSGREVTALMQNFLTSFFSDSTNLDVFADSMEEKYKAMQRKKKLTADSDMPPICLSATIVAYRDGRKECLIGLSSFSHHLPFMHKLMNFIELQNSQQSNVTYKLLQGDTGNYSNLISSIVSSVRGKQCSKQSNHCVERVTGSALTKLFLEHGEKVKIQEGIVVDLYPYPNNGQKDLFEGRLKMTPADFRHGSLDLGNGYAIPTKPACEECKILKYGALTVWKFAQEIGEGKLIMSKKITRSTSPLENSFFTENHGTGENNRNDKSSNEVKTNTPYSN